MEEVGSRAKIVYKRIRRQKEALREIVTDDSKVTDLTNECERRYLSPGPRSAAAAPLDHISQQDGHNHVTSLIVAVISVIALKRTKGKEGGPAEKPGRGGGNKESFLLHVIRSHLYVILGRNVI